MSRYKVITEWTEDGSFDPAYFAPFLIQTADIVDTRTGDTFMFGANRVIDTRTGKPAVRGKGGTHPFYGECAWMDAQRLAGDLATAETNHSH